MKTRAPAANNCMKFLISYRVQWHKNALLYSVEKEVLIEALKYQHTLLDFNLLLTFPSRSTQTVQKVLR